MINTKKIASYFVIGIAIVSLIVIVSLIRVSIKKEALIPTRASDKLSQTIEVQNNQVTLFLIGDMGQEGADQAKVALAMEKVCLEEKPDALIFLGDNIYPNGVSSVDDPAWNNKLLKYYLTTCLSSVDIYAVLGNHDYKGNAQAQVDYHDKNPRWNMPFRHYNISFGNILNLTAYDSWYSDICLLDDNCSVNFMKDSLQANQDKAWRVVMSHHPVFSISKKDGRHQGGLQGKIINYLLCRFGADAHLAGHAHHLEHSTSTCGVDTIVSGAGGGSTLYGVEQEEKGSTKYVYDKHGFIALKADQKNMKYQFYNEKGSVLYSYNRKK